MFTGERVDVAKNIYVDELHESKVLEMENENSEAVGENSDLYLVINMRNLVKLIWL